MMVMMVMILLIISDDALLEFGIHRLKQTCIACIHTV